MSKRVDLSPRKLTSFPESLRQQKDVHEIGGLRRVRAPSGDLLWVCPDHYREYDPGLPVIPGR